MKNKLLCTRAQCQSNTDDGDKFELIVVYLVVVLRWSSTELRRSVKYMTMIKPICFFTGASSDHVFFLPIPSPFFFCNFNSLREQKIYFVWNKCIDVWITYFFIISRKLRPNAEIPYQCLPLNVKYCDIDFRNFTHKSIEYIQITTFFDKENFAKCVRILLSQKIFFCQVLDRWITLFMFFFLIAHICAYG